MTKKETRKVAEALGLIGEHGEYDASQVRKCSFMPLSVVSTIFAREAKKYFYDRYFLTKKKEWELRVGGSDWILALNLGKGRVVHYHMEDFPLGKKLVEDDWMKNGKSLFKTMIKFRDPTFVRSDGDGSKLTFPQVVEELSEFLENNGRYEGVPENARIMLPKTEQMKREEEEAERSKKAAKEAKEEFDRQFESSKNFSSENSSDTVSYTEEEEEMER